MPEATPSRDLRRLIAELTPDQRARLEQRLLESRQRPANPPTPPRDRPAQLPLSFAQQRLWFLDRLEPQQGVYNIPRAVRLRGVLNVEALRRALDVIVERHEALRTTFASLDGVPSQQVSIPRPVDLRIVDLGAWPAAGREAEARRLTGEAAMRPFDLASDLMLRAILVRPMMTTISCSWCSITSRPTAGRWASFPASCRRSIGVSPTGRAPAAPSAASPVRRLRDLATAMACRAPRFPTQSTLLEHRLAGAPAV